MTRLQSLLIGFTKVSPHRADDVAKLKKKIPELAHVDGHAVERLYSSWSEDFWAAGWNSLDESSIVSFRKYLVADVNSTLEEP